MRFTVVIPTRHRNETLALCLEDLLRGDGASAEIIVTDDGDTTMTRDMVQRRFPTVRWAAGPRRGPAANRNSGARLASGEFLLFLDDDVRPSATLLGAYSAAITPEISVYEGRTTCVEGLRSPLDVAPVNETGGWLWSCNMMVRRRFWESTGGFDEDFRFAHMEDVAFRHRLNQSGEQFLFVAGAAVNHPPRRRTSFKARIPIHESHFIYYYKYLGRSPSRGQLVIEGLRGTLETIRTRPKSIDSVVALGSVCLELCGILRRWSAWDHKYRVLAKAGPMSPSTID